MRPMLLVVDSFSVTAAFNSNNASEKSAKLLLDLRGLKYLGTLTTY